MARNVLGTPLATCSKAPLTGWYRDGICRTGSGDEGLHCICAVMTAEFLRFSREQGNDLSTPSADLQFPGLKPGDRWCLCIARWQEAHRAGVAPPVALEATHISALEFVDLEDLKAHEVGGPRT